MRRDAAAQRPRLRARCEEIAELLEMAPVVSNEDIVLDDSFLPPGYGQLNEATVNAMEAAAQSEGLILDPVYSAKTMAGFIARARESAQNGGAGRALLFIHTGGTPSTFAYVTALTEALA